MAGTLRGKIDCYSKTQNTDRNFQEAFTNWINFMDDLVVAGVATLVASQYGSGGTGFDFWDGANPSGSGAFAVYKFPANGTRPNDYYVLGQWSDAANINSAPGNPARILGATTGFSGANFGVAYASALESDETTNANPWTGTTNANGTDLKSSPVWAAPVGGTLAVWPISNADGNSHAAVKENLQSVVQLNSSVDYLNLRYGFLADDDCFFYYVNIGNNHSTQWSFFGHITPFAGVDLLYELVYLKDVAEITPTSAIYGITTGNQYPDGGFHNYVTGGMDSIWINSLTSAFNVSGNPNTLNSDEDVNTYDFFPLVAYMEAGVVNRKGMVGIFDPFITSSYSMLDKFQTTDLQYTVLGAGDSLSEHNLIIKWDGNTTWGSNQTREGVDF